MKRTLTPKEQELKELQIIPGIGKSIAQDLWNLGIREVADLRAHNPEELYNELCEQAGGHIDRCVLYTFRCAVYFATEKTPELQLLKWWLWKDDDIAERTTEKNKRG